METQPEVEPKGEPPATHVLIQRMKDGNPEALDRLLGRELPWIRRLVHQRLGRGRVLRRLQDTDDVIHDLVIRLLEGGPELHMESRQHFQSLVAWIIVCKLRSARQRLLLSSNLRTMVLRFDRRRPDPAVDPHDAAVQGEEQGWAFIARQLLSSGDQEVIDLRVFDDLAFAEIGARLGIGEDAARQRFNRARERARKIAVRLMRGELPGILRELDAAGSRDSQCSSNPPQDLAPDENPQQPENREDENHDDQ